jgi:ribosomal protein L31
VLNVNKFFDKLITLSLNPLGGLRRKEIKMKKGIHPNYGPCTVTCVTCGNTFQTGSILKEIRVDTCSNCHPFYTGKQRFTQTDGRIDRFNKKYGIK